ncbi:MAG: MFS transporter [Streptosporangiaceae bacterium]|nr:MFS transporter [Streptosporangiaceae bacterium]
MTRPAQAVSGNQRGQGGPLTGAAQPLALAILCALLFLTFLDNTIVSVALGDIQVRLHADVTDLQWVLSAYALTFASLMLPCGMIGDELGRKEVMLAGAAAFCAGSMLSAFAPNAGVLIAGRAVMGVGAAASEPGTLSMIRHLYPQSRARSQAIGIWAATSGVALAAGPLIGGLLVGLWHWRAIFWFNLVFGLAVLIIAALILPESADPTAARVDTAGALLGAGALAALVFAVINAESSGFGATPVIVLLCVSAVGTVAFVWRELRAEHPLLDLRFFRIPPFGTPIVAAFCTYFATFAIFFFTALYLDEVVGLSGFKLALVFLPMTALMIVSSLAAGRWTAAVGPRWSITGGSLLFAAGLFLTNSFISPHPAYGPLIVALALAGIGIGTVMVPITSTVLTTVPSERSGMAASATNTSREMGAVIGTAVLGALVYGQLKASLTVRLVQLGVPPAFRGLILNAIETGQVPRNTAQYQYGKIVQEVIGAAYQSFHDGLQAALYLGGSLALLAGLLAFITLRPRAASAQSRDLRLWLGRSSPGLTSHVFISAEVRLDTGFNAAQARLANLARRGLLRRASHDAYHDLGTGVARVGPLGTAPGLSRLVAVRFSDMTVREDSATVAIRWETTGAGGGLFPALDADIKLTPAGDDATMLAVSGVYRAPFGSLGAGLDRVILRRIAQATIRAFADQIGAAIAHPGASSAEERVQLLPEPWPWPEPDTP